MNTFYLIRHGEKKKEWGDPGLSDVGREQARKTARYLESLSISAIFSSPSARTKETAQIFADLLNLPIVISDLLKERMSWDTPGQTFKEFYDEWEHASLNPSAKPKFGDSVKETAERLETFFNQKALPKDPKIVVVTHGGTIRDFLSMGSGEYKQTLSERILEGIHECSITEIDFENGKTTVKRFDDISHLG